MLLGEDRETNARMVYVKGIAARVSDQRGAIVLFSSPQHIGRRVHLIGYGGDIFGKHRQNGTFSGARVNGRLRCVLVFHLLRVGNYYLDNKKSQIMLFFGMIVVSPGEVEEIQC